MYKLHKTTATATVQLDNDTNVFFSQHDIFDLAVLPDPVVVVMLTNAAQIIVQHNTTHAALVARIGSCQLHNNEVYKEGNSERPKSPDIHKLKLKVDARQAANTLLFHTFKQMII